MASLKGNCSELTYTGSTECKDITNTTLSRQQEYRLSIMNAKLLFYNFTQDKRCSVSQYLKYK